MKAYDMLFPLKDKFAWSNQEDIEMKNEDSNRMLFFHKVHTTSEKEPTFMKIRKKLIAGYEENCLHVRTGSSIVRIQVSESFSEIDRIFHE